MSRARSQTDALSGITVRPAEYAEHFTEEEVMTHFEGFKEYDLDGTGFISPENLHSIMEALEVTVDMQVVQGMITEVAILCSHEDDGKLSFRDYMNCMIYEKKKDEHNRRAEQALESAEECLELGIGGAEQRARAISVEEEPGPLPAAPEEAEAEAGEEEEVELTEKMRGTSFAVMANVASKRIEMFKRRVSIEQAEQANTAQGVIERMQKFKRAEVDASSKSGRLTVKSENIELATLKNKLAAFEQAKKDADNNVAKIKKTWKKIGSKQSWGEGAHKAKRNIVGPNGEVGPPPPKALADLLK